MADLLLGLESILGLTHERDDPTKGINVRKTDPLPPNIPASEIFADEIIDEVIENLKQTHPEPDPEPEEITGKVVFPEFTPQGPQTPFIAQGPEPQPDPELVPEPEPEPEPEPIPAQPAQPVVPAPPFIPEQPAQPVDPAQPAQPAQPVQPIPAIPQRPVRPLRPVRIPITSSRRPIPSIVDGTATDPLPETGTEAIPFLNSLPIPDDRTGYSPLEYVRQSNANYNYQRNIFNTSFI